jgi:hypothetical protein
LFRFCRELYTLNEYNIPNKCWKLNLNFTKSCPYLSRFCNYTEKRQITGRKYSRHFTNKTSSEWDIQENKIWKKNTLHSSFDRFKYYCLWSDRRHSHWLKPYTHFMFIGSTWMHTLHKLNWLLACVVKLLNNFWTGTNMYLKTFTFICKVLCCHLTHLSCPYCTCMALSALRRSFAVFLRTLFCLMFRMYV